MADVLRALQFPCGLTEAWRDPHPGAYKNFTLNTGRHPVQRSRKQSLWEKPAAQRAPHSLTVSHQPPGCLPHPAAVSVSVSLRATTSTSRHTTVLGTETKACWLLAFRAPSYLLTLVGAEGVSLNMVKVRLRTESLGVYIGVRDDLNKTEQLTGNFLTGNCTIWLK